MTLTLQTDQVEQARSLLLTQFKNKAHVEALLASFIKQVQEIENMLFDLYLLRTIDAATGAQLDGVGKIVVLVRDGRNDADYRVALKTQVLINRTSCTGEELLNIIRGLIADTYSFVQREGPTSIDIDFSANVGDQPTPLNIAKQLRRIIAAGVRCVIAWDDFFGVGGRTDAFSFGPSADIDGHTGGLGNAAGTTGGYFIRASDGEVKETLV